jgi:hypothetical protein
VPQARWHLEALRSLSVNLVAEQLGSLDGAESLVREARARIRDGSRALSAALRQAWREAEAGKPEAASAVLEEFIRTQPVPWYRELARRGVGARPAQGGPRILTVEASAAPLRALGLVLPSPGFSGGLLISSDARANECAASGGGRRPAPGGGDGARAVREEGLCEPT